VVPTVRVVRSSRLQFFSAVQSLQSVSFETSFQFFIFTLTMSTNAFGPNEHYRKHNLEQFNFNKKWNGDREISFKQIFETPFRFAIGQISVDGASLLHHLDDLAPGGKKGAIVHPSINPLAEYRGTKQIHANDAQMRGHENREIRLYSILMAHIEHTCYQYAYIDENFANQGILACKYVFAEGQFDSTRLEDEGEDLEAQWAAMTVSSLKIPNDKDTIINYFNKVMFMSKLFTPEKTFAQCRIRFLNGLPPQLSNEVNAERNHPSSKYKFPDTYDYLHPCAGKTHKYAGQCDTNKLFNDFNRTWHNKIKDGSVVLRSNGNSVHLSDELNVDSANAAQFRRSANMSINSPKMSINSDRPAFAPRNTPRGSGTGSGGRSRLGNFTDKTRCYKCGGIGHVARYRRDGIEYKCATTIEIGRNILDGITYPHISGSSGAGSSANVAADIETADYDYNGPEAEPVDSANVTVDQASLAVDPGDWWTD
jgi:hypothetical protein